MTQMPLPPLLLPHFSRKGALTHPRAHTPCITSIYLVLKLIHISASFLFNRLETPQVKRPMGNPLRVTQWLVAKTEF